MYCDKLIVSFVKLYIMAFVHDGVAMHHLRQQGSLGLHVRLVAQFSIAISM